MWDCRFRPMDRQERPQSGLLRRYGWLTQEKDENLMHSMAQTVELMWNVRTASAEATEVPSVPVPEATHSFEVERPGTSKPMNNKLVSCKAMICI